MSLFLKLLLLNTRLQDIYLLYRCLFGKIKCALHRNASHNDKEFITLGVNYVLHLIVSLLYTVMFCGGIQS